MKKIDLLRLRKTAGLSQKELADRLNVQPSFLSAIENGRSRFPEEKVEKLKEIFDIEDLDIFMVDDTQDNTVIPPHTHPTDETDSLSQLLRHIHNLAHKNDSFESKKDFMERIDYLSARNDKLSERLDILRETIDQLREENYRLKELLLKNNISF